jgi:hypothetical protein
LLKARAMPHRPQLRDYNRLMADWMLLQLAAMRDQADLPRSYDRRYDRADITRELARVEAARAAALAREYQQPLGAGSLARVPDQAGSARE